MRPQLAIAIAVFLCLVSGAAASSAQTAPAAASGLDKHTVLMQDMIVKLIVESGTDFKKIRGNEVAKKPDGAVQYQAMISFIASGDEELGAMLTTDDAIVAVNGHTYFVATYVDDDGAPYSLRDFVKDAIRDMNLWKGDSRMVFSTKSVETGHPDDLASTALLLNGRQVAVLNEYLKAARSALIIGAGMTCGYAGRAL